MAISIRPSNFKIAEPGCRKRHVMIAKDITFKKFPDFSLTFS